MKKRFIINGDDLGMRWEVNEAISKAHTQGILTSTSIMTNMPLSQDAVKIVKQHKNLGVGVHLNICSGNSLSKNKGLRIIYANDELFGMNARKIWLLSLVNYNVRKAITEEFATQIQWLIDKGIKPTHLDSHMHIHNYPIIYTIVCKLAVKFGIKAVRWPFEPKTVNNNPWPMSTDKGKKNPKKLRRLAKINYYQNKRFIKSDSFFGITHSGMIDFNFFRAVSLYSEASVAEVMTHPAVTSSEYEEAKGQARQSELNGLCDKRTLDSFQKNSLELTHYGMI